MFCLICLLADHLSKAGNFIFIIFSFFVPPAGAVVCADGADGFGMGGVHWAVETSPSLSSSAYILKIVPGHSRLLLPNCLALPRAPSFLMFCEKENLLLCDRIAYDNTLARDTYK